MSSDLLREYGNVPQVVGQMEPLKFKEILIGVSEYQLTHSLPEEVKGSLPTVEEIEAELGGGE